MMVIAEAFFDGHYTNVRNVSILSKWEFDQ